MAKAPSVPSSVGRKLRTLRRRRKLTLRALAEASKVALQTIHGLERGYQKSTSIKVAQKLARALGAELSDFIPELRTG